jgi:predicted enzyme related to lactoylglutathione lyase
MAKVTGIGSIMIYANDPQALSEWYASRLGIKTSLNSGDGNYYGEVKDALVDKATPIGIYPAEQRLSDGSHAVMVNYRVDDFDEFLADLRGKGEDISKVLDEPYGKFAYLSDPEGNPIEIWAEPRR